MNILRLALLLFCLLLINCSDEPTTPLTKAVDDFWSCQQRGEFKQCYRSFAPERLSGKVDFLKNAESYVAHRREWAKQHPILESKVLSVEMTDKNTVGKVRVGLKIEGNDHIRVVQQRWRWDNSQKRWLLSTLSPPRQAPKTPAFQNRKPAEKH